MKSKFYIKILKKIAQEETTPEALKQQTISGSPPSFVATNSYPTIIQAFGTENSNYINNLGYALNLIVYYISNTKFNLEWMRSNNFEFDSSSAQITNLKNILNLCKVVYKNLFTDNGSSFKVSLSKEEINNLVNKVKTSESFTNFPTGSINNQLFAKLGRTPKQQILEILERIK